jgi:hypothetical protein
LRGGREAAELDDLHESPQLIEIEIPHLELSSRPTND